MRAHRFVGCSLISGWDRRSRHAGFRWGREMTSVLRRGSRRTDFTECEVFAEDR